jgi:uncharacterized protein YecE (DUF72 family)
LALLPAAADKLPLRHAIEVRHESFMTTEFLDISRKHHVAVVYGDDSVYPGCSDLTSTFVYARLRRSAASVAAGYSLASLKQWARHVQAWTAGKEPTGLPRIAPPPKGRPYARDVFVYFINGAKERAPAAAQRLISLLE